MRWIRSVLALVATLGAGSLIGFSITPRPSVATPTPPSQPDVLLVTVDALRADHLSLQGYPTLTSPILDAFAQRATVFTNAISQAPYTKASIGSLMSGLYPTSHKAVTTTIPFPETMTGHPTTRPAATDMLSSSITTLAEAFHAHGYRTFGYTANPFLIAAFGFDQGFDLYHFFSGGDFAQAAQVVDEALVNLRRAGTQPVFLWVHLMEPHSPYTPPPSTFHMFPPHGAPEPIPDDRRPPFWLLPGAPADRRDYVCRYDEEIAAADIAAGSLIRGFTALRPQHAPVIVVTADHGEEFLDHGGWEHGRTLHDELIHVPLIVSAPGLAAGRDGTQVQLIDLYPTLLALTGLAIPPGLAGMPIGGPQHRVHASEPAFAELPDNAYAIRWNGWKYIRHTGGGEDLYDLQSDPNERRSLAASDPSRMVVLSRMLNRHLAEAITRGEAIERTTVPIDRSVVDQLRSLGYIPH